MGYTYKKDGITYGASGNAPLPAGATLVTGSPDTAAQQQAKTIGGGSLPVGTQIDVSKLNAALDAGQSASSLTAQSVSPSKTPPPVPLAQGSPTNPAVQTGQPSPATVNATPYTGGLVDTLNAQGIPSTFADREKLAAQAGMANYTGTAEQNTQLANKYKALNAQGAPPKVDMNAPGAARAAVNSAANNYAAQQPPRQLATVAGVLQQTDPYFTQISQQVQQYMSPMNQRKSLTETYQSLTKDSGLQALDTELMDMKNVIDGTEDDIRGEITKAGGFATESQVAALTNSRNKQLIKNYNSLLDARNSKQEYINTMMGLEQQDRQMADQQFDRMMNFSFQMLDYRNKMQDNAVNSYMKVIDRVGYNGLFQMTQGDPYYQSMIENTLGLGMGGLYQLASLPPSEEDQLRTENMRLQNQKLRSDMSSSGGGDGFAPEIQKDINKENAQDYQFAKQARDSAVNVIKQATGKDDISNLTLSDMRKLNDAQALSLSKALSITTNPKATRATGAEDALGPTGWFQKAVSNPLRQTFTGQKYSPENLLNGIKAIESNYRTIESNLYGGSSPSTNSPLGTLGTLGNIIEYNGQRYNVDANGDMTPIK